MGSFAGLKVNYLGMEFFYESHQHTKTFVLHSTWHEKDFRLLMVCEHIEFTFRPCYRSLLNAITKFRSGIEFDSNFTCNGIKGFIHSMDNKTRPISSSPMVNLVSKSPDYVTLDIDSIRVNIVVEDSITARIVNAMNTPPYTELAYFKINELTYQCVKMEKIDEVDELTVIYDGLLFVASQSRVQESGSRVRASITPVWSNCITS